MNDTRLIDAILDLTCLNVGNCLRYVERNRAALGVRHQALRAERATDTAYRTHHVGRCDTYVKSEPVLCLNLLHEIVIAYEIGAGFLSLSCLIALCKNEYADLFARAVRENYRAANLLVCMAGVNAQAYMYFYRLVKLRLVRCENGVYALCGIVKLRAVIGLEAFQIFFSVLHIISSLW